MQIYLPIAELSVNIFLVLALDGLFSVYFQKVGL